MRIDRTTLLALTLAAGASAASPALADRASAQAAMPADPSSAFLTIYERPRSSTRADEGARIPEYAVYPDGTILVQMTDLKLWRGRLTADEVVGLMDFLLTDAAVPSIDMTYLTPAVSDVREYVVRTRTATHRHAMRKSFLDAGPGVKSGERALKRIDKRLFELATRADAPYDPPQVFVVSQRVEANGALPAWTSNDRLPFAALADATDADRGQGALLGGAEAATVKQALAQGSTWRFSNVAATFGMRPAFPEEARMPVWTPAGPVAPPPAPPTVPPVVPPMVPPAPPIAPPPAPPTTGPAVPPPGAADWRADDVDYAGVQGIFRGLKRKVSGSPHGAFWDKPYETFVDYSFALQTRDGSVKMIEKGNGAGSNLIKALRGEPLTIVMPDGKIEQERFPVMPPNFTVPPADIERIRRWIDHGAPKEKPAGAGGTATGPAAPPPSAPPSVPPSIPPPPPPGPLPAAPASVGSTALHLVAEGEVKLGARAARDDGDAAPSFYVARDEAAWGRVFDVGLRQRGGPNGPAVAAGLRSLREATTGYDYSQSSFVLLASPATDNYDWDVTLALETLADGSGRLVLSHRHEARKYVQAPDVLVKWALYRTDARAPAQISLKASRVRLLGPSNSD